MQFTQTQIYLILVLAASACTLLCWAIFVIIPNRNETIRFLRDRNQTLEYWVNDSVKDQGHWQPLAGDQLTRKLNDLYSIRKVLIRQVETVTIDIHYYESQKIKTDEQPGTEKTGL